MLSTRQFVAACAALLWMAASAHAGEVIARLASNGEARLMLGSSTGANLREVASTSHSADVREYRFVPDNQEFIYIFVIATPERPAVLAEFISQGLSFTSGDGAWISASFDAPDSGLSDRAALGATISEVMLRYAWQPAGASAPLGAAKIDRKGIIESALWMFAPQGAQPRDGAVFRISPRDLWPIFYLGDANVGGEKPRGAFHDSGDGGPRLGGGVGGGRGGHLPDNGPGGGFFAPPQPEFPPLGAPFNPNVPDDNMPAPRVQPRPRPLPPLNDTPPDIPGRDAPGSDDPGRTGLPDDGVPGGPNDPLPPGGPGGPGDNPDLPEPSTAIMLLALLGAGAGRAHRVIGRRMP